MRLFFQSSHLCSKRCVCSSSLFCFEHQFAGVVRGSATLVGGTSGWDRTERVAAWLSVEKEVVGSFMKHCACSSPSDSTHICCLARMPHLLHVMNPIEAQSSKIDTQLKVILLCNYGRGKSMESQGCTASRPFSPQSDGTRSDNANFSQRIWHCTVAGHCECCFSFISGP